MKENIHYVNNSNMDIRLFFAVFQSAFESGILNEDFRDIFSITFLNAYNHDGSDRMIIEAA
jgi:hypothetical protein